MSYKNYFTCNNYHKLLQLYNDGAFFTAIDTETTGLKPESEHIIEIGAVRFNKNGIISTFNTLVNPNMQIPHFITSITHITNEMLSKQPFFFSCADSFLKFIDSSILVAHNSGFDISFLNNELSRCCLPSIHNKSCDTVLMSRKYFPEFRSHKLQSLAASFSIDSGNAHRAEDDARVCMEVFLRCIKQIQGTTGNAI